MTNPSTADRLVLTEQRGPARLLTLNRPRVRNALSLALSDALVRELHAAEIDSDTTIVLVTGAGGAFCSGVDLKDLAARGFDGSQSGDGNCITHLAAMDKPVIGLVDGPAVTGGFELALACDLLIATPSARFADTHSRVGIVPGGGLTARLAQAVGLRRARQLSATGAYLDATTALSWGLVNEIVEPDELIERGWSIAEAMSAADQPTLHAVWQLYDAFGADDIDAGVDREAAVNRGWRAEAAQLAVTTRHVLAHGRSEVAEPADADAERP